jgi:hypothetical protein
MMIFYVQDPGMTGTHGASLLHLHWRLDSDGAARAARSNTAGKGCKVLNAFVFLEATACQQ